MKRSTLFKYILNIAILVGLALAAYRYLEGEEVLAALRTFNYSYAPFLLSLSAAYIVLKSWRFVPLMRQISNIHWGTIMRGYLAGIPATLIPGGVAARAGLMTQAGVPVEKSGAPVAFSSFLDQVVFVLSALFAALWFEPARLPSLILLSALILLGILAAIPGPRHWLARALEWVADKFNLLQKWRGFLNSVRVVGVPKVMLHTLGLTLLGIPLQVLMLDLSLRGVGLNVSLPALFLTYVIPSMFGRLSILPAGVGITEAGMVGFLVTTTGIEAEAGTAAVAIYRIVTVPFQALVGALIYFFFWRGDKERPQDRS